jgi:hypothetical protein
MQKVAVVEQDQGHPETFRHSVCKGVANAQCMSRIVCVERAMAMTLKRLKSPLLSSESIHAPPTAGQAGS